MPARNEPCPCGSGTKFKRCCLVKLDAVARELRERDEFLGGLIAWLKAEHAETLEEAGDHTALIRILRGVTGRNMSIVWALNDYAPADGGPVLIERYAALPELCESDRAIARGLAEARLDAHRVSSMAAGVWLGLESLSDGTSVRVAWREGVEHLGLGDVLVARVVRATSLPTLWGLGARFPAGVESRWRARLSTLPADRPMAALALLEFHPDDAAEPLPDGIDLHAVGWSIDDDEAVLEELEEDDRWECLGQALPDGWAFALLADGGSGATDLGGWQEQTGEVEVARLIVREHALTLLSADDRTLRMTVDHLRASLAELIAAESGQLAA